jgi:deazaflavin-dependent oxidoreductase (nitroreductase family)
VNLEALEPKEVRAVRVVHVVRRWLYRDRRAHRLARLLNGLQAQLAARGIGPRWLVTLEVVGRRTGKTISLPVVVADFQGGRYLVSMLGDNTNWVRNVRAAGGRAVLRHGRRETVRLDEVDPGQRAPILRQYLDRAAGARSHIAVDRQASLEQLEEAAARYPVFKITVQQPKDKVEASRQATSRTRPA